MRRNRTAVFTLGVFSILLPAHGQEREQLAKSSETRAAELVYKNIQVLKGVPASEVLTIMKAFTGDLGVRCEYCHVTAPGSDIPGFYAWSSDEVAAKKTARVMMRMVAGIGKEYFAGTKGPACWTCHRGNTKPELEKPAK